MNVTDHSSVGGYEDGGWLSQVKKLVEQEGTPFLCVYFDQKTQQVNLIADSESQQKLRESKVFPELENIVKRTAEQEAQLQLYNHQLEALKPCTRSAHACHQFIPSTFNQFSWEKNLPECFEDQCLPTDSYDGLPAEVLRMIFGFLDSGDLKNVLLVSRTWKSAAEAPGLWTGFGLPKKSRLNPQNLSEFLKTSLSSKLKHLTLAEYGRDSFKFHLADEHFRQFLKLDLSSISIKKIELTDISDELLGHLVNNCKECDIKEYCIKPWMMRLDEKVYKLGIQKLSAIFKQMQYNTKLKSFKLSSPVLYEKDRKDADPKIDLSSIPAKLLARSFSKLEILSLEDVELYQEQLDAMFEVGFVNLTSLSLGNIDFLDGNDVKNLLLSLDKSSRLESLKLSKVYLSEVESLLLSRVINKMVSVVLEEVEIDANQIEEIFHVILSGDSVMKNLSLIYVKNLVDVSPVVFARAVNRLESVTFDRNMMSDDQTKEMFKVMSQETSLKALSFSSHDFDYSDYVEEVDPEVLALALNNLETLRMDLGYDKFGSNLTTEQLFAFFKQLSLKSKLKNIFKEDRPYFKL